MKKQAILHIFGRISIFFFGGIALAAGATVFLFGVQAFQSITPSYSTGSVGTADSFNSSLTSPLLTKSASNSFNRQYHSLEAIAEQLWLPTTGKIIKRIFVTSTTYTGNLWGLAWADASCQARATAWGLTGTWKAMLSSSTTTAISRLTGSHILLSLKWEILAVNPRGLGIFSLNYVKANSSQYELLWGRLTYENGTYVDMVTANIYTWSATSSNWVLNGDTCLDWTSAWSTGRYGYFNWNASDYLTAISSTTNVACSNTYTRLLCLEQ